MGTNKKARLASGTFGFLMDGDCALSVYRSVEWATEDRLLIECTVKFSQCNTYSVGHLPLSPSGEYTKCIDVGDIDIDGASRGEQEPQQKILDKLAEDDSTFKARNPRVK